MSTPAIRGMFAPVQLRVAIWIRTDNRCISEPETRTLLYPCFCLCLVLVQITRTTPLRRTILQFSQIRRTLARTFMTALFRPLPTHRKIVEPIFVVKKPSAESQLPKRLCLQSPRGAARPSGCPPRLGHRHRMLKMGRRLAILGDDRPAVLEQLHVTLAQDHHRLDRQGHARPQLEIAAELLGGHEIRAPSGLRAWSGRCRGRRTRAPR